MVLPDWAPGIEELVDCVETILLGVLARDDLSPPPPPIARGANDAIDAAEVVLLQAEPGVM